MKRVERLQDRVSELESQNRDMRKQLMEMSSENNKQRIRMIEYEQGIYGLREAQEEIFDLNRQGEMQREQIQKLNFELSKR